jgi:hypothetical protein
MCNTVGRFTRLLARALRNAATPRPLISLHFSLRVQQLDNSQAFMELDGGEFTKICHFIPILVTMGSQ